MPKGIPKDPNSRLQARAPRRSSHALDAAIAPGTLAARVLELMRERGLSARDLSTRAGLSGDAVRSLLRGRISSPRAQSLVQLAAALGVSVDGLTGGTVQVPDTVQAAALVAAPDALDVEVPEIDLRVRGGKPLEADVMRGPKRRSWRLPKDLLDERGLDSGTLAVVRVGGGEPGYGPTDRLLVDVAARRATGGALLVVHDGGEEHTLVRVRAGHVHGRGAMVYPGADEGSRPLDEIVGTVVGRWTWE